MSSIEYNLFNMLLERSAIKSNIESIDLIVFFVCFRIILFCDEVHDFSGNEKFKIQNTSDQNKTTTLYYTWNTVLDLRKKECNKNIRDFLIMYSNSLIESSLYVDDNYMTGKKCKILAMEFKRKNLNFKQFILNMRAYLINVIYKFNNNPNEDIINEVFKIVRPSISTAINDENCKLVVRFLTMNIFGITNMPSYMCSLTPEPPNIIQANKYPTVPNIVLFIDQIGTTKNYLSVLNTINIIVNQTNFYNKANNTLRFNKTNANIYDAATPTGIEKSVGGYGSDYNISIYSDSYNDIKLDQNIIIKFDNFIFIEFKFSKNNNDIALTILNYFGNTSIYNSSIPILGGTKGNASKTKIKMEISNNINNHFMIPYKTMGDFLQIFTVKLFEEKNKNIIQDTSTFITGDIICGYLGGILLENSILEKQTDESGPLISEYSLTNFYNINEIRKCFVNYHILDKDALSSKFRKYLHNIYEEKVCYDFPELNGKPINPIIRSGPKKTIIKNIDKKKTLVKDKDFDPSSAFQDCIKNLTIDNLDGTNNFYLEILKSFLIDNFNVNNDFDTEFNRVLSLRSFRDLGFSTADTKKDINNLVKRLIKECIELKYKNSFGKYIKNEKVKLQIKKSIQNA